MIRLSRLADYGIVMLSHLGREPALVMSARELADATRLAAPTVAKVAKMLCRGGLVRSRRGLRGGYCLARPARQITVVDVISAMDGPIAMTACSTPQGPGCSLERGCPVRLHWQRINQTVIGALRHLTLHEMRAPMPAQAGAAAPPGSLLTA